MLGCCQLDGNPCLVMSLYSSSAAKRLETLQGNVLSLLYTVSSFQPFLVQLLQSDVTSQVLLQGASIKTGCPTPVASSAAYAASCAGDHSIICSEPCEGVCCQTT